MHRLGALLLLLPHLALAGDCPDYAEMGTSPEVAASRLAEAEAIYPRIYDELSQLPEIDTWLIDGVSCLTEPVLPSLAARYHRFRALKADPLGGLGDKVRERALASLGAAHRLEPGHTSTLPSDHGHHAEHAVAPQDEATAPPAEGQLFFDGAATPRRPAATATFFQRTDANGTVVDSAYLYPGDALPPYPQVQTAEIPVRSKKKGLRFAGIGVGIAAGGLGVTNLLMRRDALSSTETHAQDRQLLVNTLAVSSWVTGAASVGLLTTSFVVK